MKQLYLFGCSMICGVLLTGNANAQMVGSDVFLKGKYVELGIANWGWYGTTTSPAGFHPHPGGGGTGLGFVADPDMDGWAVGSPPFYGDYFLPGTPFEGWELQINGPRCSAYNPTFTGTVLTGAGANVSYTTSGSKVIGTWQGVFDSLQLTQETSLDTNSLFFIVKITMTNLAVAPKDNIYYLRTLDPDNDDSEPGGSFITRNKVEHQSTDTTVVSAVGNVYSAAYLALGTTDTNATCFIYTSWPLSSAIDLSTIYSHTYTPALYAQGSSDTADASIGLLIKVPHLATVDSATDSVYRTTSTYALHPANSASFSYFYSFSPAATDSALKLLKNTPLVTTRTINNVNNAADINVYPNPSKDLVNITGLNTTDHISMYDMMGRAVNQNWFINSNGTNTFRYNNLAAGAYILLVTDANGNVRSRVPVRKQ